METNTRPQIPRRHGGRRRIRRSAALGLSALIIASACTTGLREGADDSDGQRLGDLTEWPDAQPVATTSSPAMTDVEIDVRPLVRDEDGIATVEVDVRNQSTRPLRTDLLFGSGGTGSWSIIDPSGPTAYRPMATSSAACVCSRGLQVPGGATVTLHATFEGLPEETESVRVHLPRWRPVDDVPVNHMGGFPVQPSVATEAEAAPGHVLEVERAWNVEEGTVVRVSERNEGSDEIQAHGRADLSTLRLVDLDELEVAHPLRSGVQVVSSEREGGILPGESASRDVLLARLPSGSAEFVVTVDGFRRTLPMSISDDGPEPALEIGALEDPITESLTSARSNLPSDLIPVAEPESIDLALGGSAFDLPSAGTALSSEAQPDFTFAPRAVVRTGDARSVLFMDLEVDGSGWPEGLGSSNVASDLGAVAVVDVDNQERFLPLRGDDGVESSHRLIANSDRDRLVYVAFPAIEDGTASVTVDVPGFGQATDVPVIDSPTVGGDDEVLATMHPDWNLGLRIDLLAVSQQAGAAGTLVRFRAVNESDPGAVDAPFVAHHGCSLWLVDPDTNRRFRALQPCLSTDWTTKLGSREGLVYEVRFPNLPDDVERVVISGDRVTTTPPIPLGDSDLPWYLSLPAAADAPRGDTLRGSIGFADDLQRESQDGDEVVLELDTDVLFEFGSAELTAEAAARVRSVAERLIDESSGEMTVVGHTDSVGSADSNMDLSRRRAQAVAAVLEASAGDRFDLTVDGEGDTDPVAPNEIDGRDNPDGRERNRRVTITYRST